MAKKPTVTTLASGFNSTEALNANFEALRDSFDNTLSLDGSTPNALGVDLDLNNNNIINANAIMVGGSDVVTTTAAALAAAVQAQIDADAAVVASALSETNAANSATASQTSANASQASRLAAEVAETNAELAETNAEIAEVNAETSATNSAGSANASLASQVAASGSAAAALASQVDANTSQGNASVSALAASNSETAAALSESNAATSETNAATSETNAAASATASANSATASANSAIDATNNGAAQLALNVAQVALANTARTGAELAETNAATSETNAAVSETNAAASETEATAQAVIATTKAAEAAASAASVVTDEAATAAYAAASASSATDSANSAASAAASLDNFDDRYLGSKSSEPTLDNDGNALISGALYFSSTANAMQVFDGANWIAASASGVASMTLYEYTATAGQTTFTGADDNNNSISFIQGNEIVVLNGIILDPSDYNSTSGTSIVLTVGTVASDVLNVYAFKSFTVADTVSASTGGTFGGDVAVTGNITVTGTVDGRDVAADGTKLDGLDAADYATAAQGATADSALQPTGDGSQLTGLYADADVATYLAGVGNVVVGGTVDGRDLALDGAVIDGLATVATSGSFNDLLNQPSPFDPNTLATVATSGAYSDLSGTPSVPEAFPAGTKMMFQQTSAPTGWTKDTTHNNKALRVVNGTAGSGGSVNFSTAFANKTTSGSIGNTSAGGTVAGHTLTTAQTPSHSHYLNGNGNMSGGFSYGYIVATGGVAYGQSFVTNSIGGNGSHSHGFTGASHNHSFSGSAIDLRVQYVDLIIATKN